MWERKIPLNSPFRLRLLLALSGQSRKLHSKAYIQYIHTAHLKPQYIFSVKNTQISTFGDEEICQFISIVGRSHLKRLFFFSGTRFRYPRDEDHLEGSRAQRIPHLQDLCGQSHRPHLRAGQRHAIGQGGDAHALTQTHTQTRSDPRNASQHCD